MPKTQAPARTHFVVERFNWRRGNGTFFRFPGSVRVASFDTAARAEAFRRDREAAARAEVNPFAGAVAPPAALTHMPEGVLCDWLLDHGLTPPPVAKKTGRRGWAAWWDKQARKWTADQRAAVWEALDCVRFYRVTERQRRPVAYAVVRVVWQYNDDWYYPGSEGGQVQTAYRTREKAEAECRRRDEAERRRWARTLGRHGDDESLCRFDPEDRVLPGREPFDPPPVARGRTAEGLGQGDFALDEVPFYEVVEVELEGGA